MQRWPWTEDRPKAEQGIGLPKGCSHHLRHHEKAQVRRIWRLLIQHAHGANAPYGSLLNVLSRDGRASVRTYGHDTSIPSHGS